jgi:hypothetical protein
VIKQLKVLATVSIINRTLKRKQNPDLLAISCFHFCNFFHRLLPQIFHFFVYFTFAEENFWPVMYSNCSESDPVLVITWKYTSMYL